MMISIIVAIAEDYGIGKGNDLLFRISDDLKHFKSVTLGKPVIMGKRTWESLPKRPLSGRRNIVLTDILGEVIPGAETVFSINGAVEVCKDEEEVFVIGGGSVYRQFMGLADRLYITKVFKRAEADVYFPEINGSEWELKAEEPHLDGAIPYSYQVYERIKKAV